MCDENSLFFYLNNFLNGGIIKKKTQDILFSLFVNILHCAVVIKNNVHR